MKYRALFVLLLSASLFACSATGPVKFYSGAPKPNDQLAIITVPAALTVDSIDGRVVDAPSKTSGTYEVQLEPGFHLIDFRYVMYWGSNDSGMLVRSKPTGVDAVFQAGHRYTIRYKKPQDASDAKEFFTDFNAQLVDLDTGKTHDSYVIADLSAALTAARAKHEKQAAAMQAATAGTQTAMPDAKTATTGNPVKHLKFWWLMANPQQRKAFMDWMRSATESFAPGADAGTTTTAPAEKTPPPPADTINGIKIKP